MKTIVLSVINFFASLLKIDIISRDDFQLNQDWSAGMTQEEYKAWQEYEAIREAPDLPDDGEFVFL